MIKQRLKWIALAAWAAFLAILALVYGKRTGTVLRAAIEAHNARGRLLNEQIELERAKAQGKSAEQAEQAKSRLVRLEAERERIRARRVELTEESGDLPTLNDADLAKHDNRRRAAAARSG